MKQHAASGRVWAGTATVRTPADIESVLRILVDALQRTSFSSTEIESVQLAVQEAIINAIEHGHRGDPTKQVRIRYLINPLDLLTQIEDEGAGIRPDSTGRGLRLMRQHMTEVRYNACGNCVTLVKRRCDDNAFV
jgi:anti-sigma regulatory factor (Ser/Thr protein kinase)